MTANYLPKQSCTNRYILGAVLCGSLALAGCATSSGLHTEGEAIAPASLHAERSLGKLKLSSAAWPASDWWKNLGDAQLDALVAEALKGNPDLAAAAARARGAQAQIDTANSRRMPSVNADASVTGIRLPTTAFPKPLGGSFQSFPAIYTRFNWSLDLWGGKRAAWEAAIDQARAAEIDAHAARLALSTNVARAYVQLDYAYVTQDIARAQRARASASRELVRQRVAAGIDSQLQVKQADAEVASADQQAALAEQAIDAARISLALLLGRGPDRGLDIARPHALRPGALLAPPNLAADLLGRRADLVAARWRVEAASRNIAAVKTEFLPNIGINAMAGLTSSSADNLFSLPARFFDIAPAVSLPIFDGGRRRADLKGADATYDLAVAQYNSALVAAIDEVAAKYSDLEALAVQIAAQQRAVDAAQQAFDLSRQRDKAGVGSYLDSLAVQQQLLAAEQRIAALAAQRIDASVRLVQALGGGFDAGETAPPSTTTQP